jgi:hypothetical protein
MKTLILLKLIFLFGSILFYLPTVAQLKADAGEDRIVCAYNYGEEIEIGGSPTASGGIEPYAYTWSGVVLHADYIDTLIYATNELDDPAKSNPTVKIEDILYEWYEFYLKVEDAVGIVAYDTVKITNANVWDQLFFDSYNIIKDDSIQLTGPFFRNDYLKYIRPVTSLQILKLICFYRG